MVLRTVTEEAVLQVDGVGGGWKEGVGGGWVEGVDVRRSSKRG